MFAKVVFSVEGGLCNDFLNCLLDSGYRLSHVIHTQLGFTAVCYGDDYLYIARMGRRFQCRTRIIHKKGLYFRVARWLKRKGIFVGICLFFILSYGFSHLIWDIDIKTDDAVLKNEIAILLYENDIYAGAFYTEEKLDNAKDNIMLVSQELGYLTLNFYKGILTVEVYPRTHKAQYLNGKSQSDIYARQSGIITDLRVYEGFSQVELGQSVSRGDLLVSNITADKFGNTYSSDIRAYIEALCYKTYSVFIPFSRQTQVLTGVNDVSVAVRFWDTDFIIKQADTGKWQDFMVKKEMDYFSFLGFHLPVTVTTTTFYQLSDIVIASDTLTARNIAKLHIEQMINNDDMLKDEINRSYDYVLKTDGLQLNCIVTGHYQIT